VNPTINVSRINIVFWHSRHLHFIENHSILVTSAGNATANAKEAVKVKQYRIMVRVFASAFSMCLPRAPQVRIIIRVCRIPIRNGHRIQKFSLVEFSNSR